MPDQFTKAPVSLYRSFSCIDNSNSDKNINEVANSGLISNCEFYHDLGGSNYGCAACKMGYGGTVASGKQFISSCEPISGCNSSMKYEGLTFSAAGTNANHIENLLSCHSCTDSTKIPQIKGQITNTQFTFFHDSANTTEKTVECVTKPGGLTANCAVVIAHHDGTSFVNKCGACMPGYAPTYDGTDTWVVNSCTEIANCQLTGSMWFNHC